MANLVSSTDKQHSFAACEVKNNCSSDLLRMCPFIPPPPPKKKKKKKKGNYVYISMAK